MDIAVKNAAVLCIEGYQRYISPHKGYCCAHRALHNRMSCSESVKSIIIKYGIYRSLPLIVRRFKACNAAYKTLSQSNESSTEHDKQSKHYNPLKDKENAACCLSAWPCIPM